MQDLNHSAGASLGAQQRWERPSFRWLKCNVDTAFHRADGTAATVCCVHDTESTFVLAQTTWKHAQWTVLQDEALVFMEAIRLVGYASRVEKDDFLRRIPIL